MTDFRRQAELTKLSRLLHCTPAALDYLQALDVPALHNLRLSCTQQLLGEQRALFGRIAAASKLLPSTLVAFIAERTMGPLLCARIAGEMPAARAIEITRHLEPGFMARSAVFLEADKARELTAALPLSSVVKVTRKLMEQREYITLSDLVGTLPISLIESVLREVRDGEALLQTGFFIDDAQRLNDILDILPADYLNDLIRAAADESTDLWPHALALMSVVAPHWQARLVNMAADGDEDTLSSMVRGVVKHDLWAVTLPLMGLMTEANRRRVINLPVLQDDAVLRRILRAAEQHQLWNHLLPLIPLMELPLRQRAARLTDELSENTIRELVQAFYAQGLWPHGLLLIEHMGIVRRATIAELVAESSDEAIMSLLASVRENQQWQLILPLIDTMTEKAQQRFVSLPFFQNEAALHDIIRATDQHSLWKIMLPLVGLMQENEQRSVARFAEALDGEAIRRWSGSIDDARHWPLALQVIGFMRPERRTSIALQVSEHEDAVLNSMLRALHQTNDWPLLLNLLNEIPLEAQHRLLDRARQLDEGLRLQLLIAADKQGLCDPVLLRMAELPEDDRNSHRAVFLRLPADHLGNLRQRCQALGLSALLD